MASEPEREIAEARLSQGLISTVNVAEGDYVASGRGDLAAAQQVFTTLELPAAPDRAQAARAAGLRRRGVALGGRFCLASGEAQGERIATVAQDWADTAGLSTLLEMIR